MTIEAADGVAGGVSDSGVIAAALTSCLARSESILVIVLGKGRQVGWAKEPTAKRAWTADAREI